MSRMITFAGNSYAQLDVPSSTVTTRTPQSSHHVPKGLTEITYFSLPYLLYFLCFTYPAKAVNCALSTSKEQPYRLPAIRLQVDRYSVHRQPQTPTTDTGTGLRKLPT